MQKATKASGMLGEEQGRLPAREREIVALVYLGAIIPLLGILLAGAVAHHWRQRSRRVVFHARQSVAGQAVALLAFVAINLLRLAGALLGALDPRVREILLLFTDSLLILLAVAYWAWHLFYAWKSLEGRDLNYPVIGARLREEME
jgi:uncharacterized Tic20 family protein